MLPKHDPFQHLAKQSIFFAFLPILDGHFYCLCGTGRDTISSRSKTWLAPFLLACHVSHFTALMLGCRPGHLLFITPGTFFYVSSAKWHPRKLTLTSCFLLRVQLHPPNIVKLYLKCLDPTPTPTPLNSHASLLFGHHPCWSCISSIDLQPYARRRVATVAMHYHSSPI